MCKITDTVQDAVEYSAGYLRKRQAFDFDDLVQEGLWECLENGKENQTKTYYATIAYNRMIKYLAKERLRGLVINEHGGDRKSKKFKDEQKELEGIYFVSLDVFGEDYPPEPLHFGKKTSVPDYDNCDSDYQSENDKLTEHCLNGGNV